MIKKENERRKSEMERERKREGEKEKERDIKTQKSSRNDGGCNLLNDNKLE